MSEISGKIDLDKLAKAEKISTSLPTNEMQKMDASQEDAPLNGANTNQSDILNSAKVGLADLAGTPYGVDIGKPLTGGLPAVLPNLIGATNGSNKNELEQVQNLLAQSKLLQEKQKAKGLPNTALSEQDLQKMGLNTPNTDQLQNLMNQYYGGKKDREQQSKDASDKSALGYYGAQLGAAPLLYSGLNASMAERTAGSPTLQAALPISMAENEGVSQLPQVAQKVLTNPLVDNTIQGAKIGAMAGATGGESRIDNPKGIAEEALQGAKGGAAVAGAMTAGLGVAGNVANKLVKEPYENNFKFPQETGNSFNKANVNEYGKNQTDQLSKSINDALENSNNLIETAKNKASQAGEFFDISPRINNIQKITNSIDANSPVVTQEQAALNTMIDNFKANNPDLTKVPINKVDDFLNQLNDFTKVGQKQGTSQISDKYFMNPLSQEAGGLKKDYASVIDQYGPYSEQKDAQHNLYATMSGSGVPIKGQDLALSPDYKNQQISSGLNDKIQNGQLDMGSFGQGLDKSFPELAVDKSNLQNAINYSNDVNNPTSALNKPMVAVGGAIGGGIGNAIGGPAMAAPGVAAGAAVASAAPEAIAGSLGKLSNKINSFLPEESTGSNIDPLLKHLPMNIEDVMPKQGPPLQDNLPGISPKVSDYVARNQAQATNSKDFAALNSASKDELTDLATKIKNNPLLEGQSDNGSALQSLAVPLLRAATAPEATKSALLWGLYSQPAFKMFLKQNSQDKNVPLSTDQYSPKNTK